MLIIIIVLVRFCSILKILVMMVIIWVDVIIVRLLLLRQINNKPAKSKERKVKNSYK